MSVASTALGTSSVGSAYPTVVGTGLAEVVVEVVPKHAGGAGDKIPTNLAVSKTSSTYTTQHEITLGASHDSSNGASSHSSAATQTLSLGVHVQPIDAGAAGSRASADRTAELTFLASIRCSEVVL